MLKIHFLGTGTSQGIPIIGSKHPVCLSDNPKDKRLKISIFKNMRVDDVKSSAAGIASHVGLMCKMTFILVSSETKASLRVLVSASSLPDALP